MQVMLGTETSGGRKSASATPIKFRVKPEEEEEEEKKKKKGRSTFRSMHL